MTDMTKWPRLLVVGETITPEQADEVLIRTNTWDGFGLNEAFENQVFALAGIRRSEYRAPDWESRVEFMTRIGALNLRYLSNDRIGSSWFGGSHGWCDWDGSIGCSTFNIGKWPSSDEVLQEWKDISQAFPFLDLTAQLVPNEGDSDMAVATFRIRDGQATCDEDLAPLIRPVEEVSFNPQSFMSGDFGVGVSLEHLSRALDRMR